MNSVESRFTVAGSLEWSDVQGEVILLDTSRGLFFGLDGASARIWVEIARGHSIQEIAEIITADYDVEPDHLAGDIQVFATALAARQLITPTAP